MIADLVIRGGTLVTPEGERRGAVAIAAGQIVAVDRDDAMPASRETIDATGLHVLPGVIDTHVHLRDPGMIEREDWLTGTRAAAAGGITTILEMPISMPAVHTAAILRQRAAHVQPRSLVDFALYAGAGDDNLDEIAAMAEAGAVAFKTFRTNAPKGRKQEFAGLCCPDAGQMLEAMTRTARTGLLHVVHAEEQQILSVAETRVRGSGRNDGIAHALARPEVAEAASVVQCVAIAEATGARLQIAHMTAAGAIRAVARAKEAGLRVTAETCPHYLMFTDDALAQWGPYAKCNPPLRSRETQDILWEAVRSGIIDVIGTDHAPFLAEEKEPFRDSIWGATAGMPALEQLLPLMLTTVHQGRLALPQLVKLTSENPARLFGLWPRKGRVAAGAEADLVLVDARVSWVHDHRTLETKSRETALLYDGIRMSGRPVRTLVRGRTIMANGSITGDPGWGQWVRPS